MSNVIIALTELGNNVYDFRNPESSFDWAHIDPDWEKWGFDEFMDARKHPLSLRGWASRTAN